MVYVVVPKPVFVQDALYLWAYGSAGVLMGRLRKIETNLWEDHKSKKRIPMPDFMAARHNRVMELEFKDRN